MEFEICIDSLEGALAADKYGADRVELCSALYEGGLTPSIGLVKSCVENSNQKIFTMIRPEAGGFTYSTKMVEVMKKDIVSMAEVGAKGVVFGVLNSSNQIDVEVNRELTLLAKSMGLQVVFHRAFDFCTNPEKALEHLIEMGVDRLLTSGQQPKAIEGILLIEKLVKISSGRIQIMAGSGVDSLNTAELMGAGVDALHFTGTRILEEQQLGMGVKYEVDENKISSMLKWKR